MSETEPPVPMFMTSPINGGRVPASSVAKTALEMKVKPALLAVAEDHGGSPLRSPSRMCDDRGVGGVERWARAAVEVPQARGGEPVGPAPCGGGSFAVASLLAA